MQKQIIVTGASRGIGYETTLALAAKGHRVLAVARSEDKLEVLKANIPNHIDRLAIDLTETAGLKKITGYVREHFNGLDVLINSAGALVNKPFVELEDSDWQKMLDVNLTAAVQLIKRLIPHFNEGSHVVNISSMGGFQGSAKFPGLTAYSVAKGALSILSECLAVELRDQNIHTNALCIGAVQTEMLEEAFPGLQAPVTAQQMGEHISDFALNGAAFYNGKILPVALEDPE